MGEECGRALHDAHLSAMRLREDGAPGVEVVPYEIATGKRGSRLEGT